MSERGAVRRRLRAYVIELKESSPCVDCVATGLIGLWPHEAMQFDHIPGRGEKKGTINVFVARADEEGLMAEISKCEVVCANHHATRSKKRGKSPETIARMTAAGIRRMASPEVRSKSSETARRLWEDPVFRERQKLGAEKRRQRAEEKARERSHDRGDKRPGSREDEQGVQGGAFGSNS